MRKSLATAALLSAVIPVAYSVPEEEQTLIQMDHATWTARDGAPQGILALAQARDGTLWIGSEAGLFNFDGRTFTPFRPLPDEPQLPADPVISICISKDDSLWVGFYQSGAAHIAQGRVRLYAKVGEKRLGNVQSLRQAADGSVWGLSGVRRLVRFGADLVWHEEPTPKSGIRMGKFLIDSSNTLWLAQNGRLYRRPLSESEYTATEIEAALPFGFAETSDGSIWMTDIITTVDRGRTQHFDHLGHLITLLPAPDEANDILKAVDGSLILATQANGLRRFQAEALTAQQTDNGRAPPDAFTNMDGLTSNELTSLLLDADGNIWVGGRRGLDRFRKAQLVRFVPHNPSGKWAICSSKQGVVWIAGSSNQLYKVSGGATVSFSNVGDIYSLFCAEDGDVWLEDHAGIWNVHLDQLKPVLAVPGMAPFDVAQVVSTADHTLYATIGVSGGGGYWKYKNNQWTKLVGEGVLGEAGYVEYLDSRDRLWMGQSNGIVTLPLEGRLLSTGEPGLGNVRAILETSHGVFAGGANGAALLRENRFEMLAFADEAPRGVAGMVESRNGDLWLNAVHGIVHVSASELERALSDSGYRIKSEILTEGDFVGARQKLEYTRTVARDTKGNLWFATLNGIIHIDPEHWRPESQPPIVAIKSIAADRHPLDDRRVFGPRPQSLEIRYLGVNLTAPEQVIYRYRLDGFDDSWQEVGHRTEAIYTRLPSGTYTFRVMASNGNEVWTPPVASAPFRILPSFYQTTWFAAICVCTILVAGWFAFRIRVRAITREVRARAEERADERIRIARELHDTLLQGIQGLLLTFHVAAQKISPDDESKQILDRALSAADRIIIEGRNRVSRLRSDHVSDSELVASLENVCNDLKTNDGAQCRVSRHGVPVQLYPHVGDEIFYIAREALTNAFRHSRASHITVDLIYGRRFFALVVKDDGRGFEPQEQEKLGHWGLTGMQERVRKLGGKLRCRSTPQDGTTIIASLAAYKAYPKHSRLMFYLRALNPSQNPPIEA